jgi:hypothetical protein
MPGFANIEGVIGNQPINVYGLPDTEERHRPGFLLSAIDTYWGAGEFIYCRANGTINAQALCVITPVFSTNRFIYNATEVPNTANLGRMVGVAMTSATSGQFFWLMVTGVVPVRSTASVAADSTFGITGAGQIGANSAGRQILNARSVAAATTTVAKTGLANSGSTRLQINNADGWFVGAYLSGTGIAATTTVVDIDPAGLYVTLSLVTTAAVNGTVTATYNNSTVFYNVVHINRPFAQGAIT